MLFKNCLEEVCNHRWISRKRNTKKCPRCQCNKIVEREYFVPIKEDEKYIDIIREYIKDKECVEIQEICVNAFKIEPEKISRILRNKIGFYLKYNFEYYRVTVIENDKLRRVWKKPAELLDIPRYS